VTSPTPIVPAPHAAGIGYLAQSLDLSQADRRAKRHSDPETAEPSTPADGPRLDRLLDELAIKHLRHQMAVPAFRRRAARQITRRS